MDIMIQRFFYDKGEMRALGTITVEILPFVMMALDGVGKHLLGFLYLHPDLGQIGQLHRRAVLVDQRFQVQAVELKVSIFDLKSFLRKIEGLRHQVGVRVVH